MTEQTDARALRDNLKAAGCDAKTTERFLQLETAGERREQLRLLAAHRQRLLDRVHREERRISCLDYLVYQLHRRDGAGT